MACLHVYIDWSMYLLHVGCCAVVEGSVRRGRLTGWEPVQDTIKSPGENGKMKRATLFGIATTTFFYAAIGLIGYAAFGNSAPGNLLSGFGF